MRRKAVPRAILWATSAILLPYLPSFSFTPKNLLISTPIRMRICWMHWTFFEWALANEGISIKTRWSPAPILADTQSWASIDIRSFDRSIIVLTKFPYRAGIILSPIQHFYKLAQWPAETTNPATTTSQSLINPFTPLLFSKSLVANIPFANAIQQHDFSPHQRLDIAISRLRVWNWG